jgi:hypothetical protein
MLNKLIWWIDDAIQWLRLSGAVIVVFALLFIVMSASFDCCSERCTSATEYQQMVEDYDEQ